MQHSMWVRCFGEATGLHPVDVGPGRAESRLWDRPDKVMRWFVYALLPMALLVALVWTHEDREHGYFALGGAVVVALQALVYGPRA